MARFEQKSDMVGNMASVTGKESSSACQNWHESELFISQFRVVT